MNGKTNFLNLLLCYFVSSELNQISAKSQVTESSQFVNETATSTINTSALFNLQTHNFINEMFGPNYSSYMTVCNSFDCVVLFCQYVLLDKFVDIHEFYQRVLCNIFDNILIQN